MVFSYPSLADFDPLGDFTPPDPPSVDEVMDELSSSALVL